MKLEKWTWKIVSIEASSSNRDNQDGKIKCLITFAGMKPRLIFLHANFLFSFLDPPQDIERIILIISWLNEILIIRKRVSNTRDFFFFFFFFCYIDIKI